MIAPDLPLFIRLRFYHVILWILYFVFWLHYLSLAEPKQPAFLIALLTTGLAVILFYGTLFYFTEYLTKELYKFSLFIILILTGVAFIRAIVILLFYRILFPAYSPPNFAGNWVISFLHFAFIVLLAVAIRLFIDKDKEVHKMELIHKNNLLTELKFLKDQINPHFLFNVHNSIYFLIDENPKLASEALIRLSGIMSYQLYECDKDRVSLQKELKSIESYIELEKLRLGEKVMVDYDFNGMYGDLEIAPFILMTLIENAFKHLSPDSNGSRHIRVSSSLSGYNFMMNVVNTVELISTHFMEKNNSEGIGIKNLERRLNILYPDKYDLIFTRDSDTYTACLKIQLK